MFISAITNGGRILTSKGKKYGLSTYGLYSSTSWRGLEGTGLGVTMEDSSVGGVGSMA